MPRPRKYATNGERQAAYRRRCVQQTDVNLITQASVPFPSQKGRRRWRAMLKAASVLLDGAAREMHDYINEHSEAWQDSPAGESLAEIIESVEDALASLENTVPQTRQGKAVVT